MSIKKLSLINKDFLTLSLCVLISIFIFFSNDSKYVKKIESIVIDICSVVFYPQSWYKNILIVKEENQILKQNIVQLKMYNAKLNNYKIENEKLRKMLLFKEAYEKLNLMPANIVNHNFSSSPNSIIIDLGKSSNIFINQPIIDMQGLVGKTINVGSIATKAQVITDKNFAVSVKVGPKMHSAIFKPHYGKYGVLEGVVKSTEINVGEIIYTSGISEIYPPDIPVCKIIEVTNDDDKPFLNVVVEILSDLSNLNYVFVIQ